jgi:hypothetical protein
MVIEIFRGNAITLLKIRQSVHHRESINTARCSPSHRAAIAQLPENTVMIMTFFTIEIYEGSIESSKKGIMSVFQQTILSVLCALPLVLGARF